MASKAGDMHAGYFKLTIILLYYTLKSVWFTSEFHNYQKSH
jgi:hypothetical protein